MATKLTNLEDLYIDLLKDLYSAETQLEKALPKMSKAAQSSNLRRGFDEHLRQTQGQVKRLEKIFSELGRGPRGKKCVGMEGLIKEGDEVMKENMDADVMDAALIAAAQKVEHYEIASYGTARTYAHALGYQGAANLLQQTLNEESATNEKLTKLAEQGINQEAMQESQR
jgi:ferritin-like metal-binding protein YciE